MKMNPLTPSGPRMSWSASWATKSGANISSMMSRFPPLTTSSQCRRTMASFSSECPCICAGLLFWIARPEPLFLVVSRNALGLSHLAFSLLRTGRIVLIHPVYLLIVVEKDHRSSGRAVERIFERVLELALDYGYVFARDDVLEGHLYAGLQVFLPVVHQEGMPAEDGSLGVEQHGGGIRERACQYLVVTLSVVLVEGGSPVAFLELFEKASLVVGEPGRP